MSGKTIFAAAVLVAVTLSLRAGLAEEATPAQSIRKTLSSVRLGSPVSQRGMTIIPIIARSESALGLRTLSEALKSGSVVVREIGDGRVNELSVENKSDAYVFILAGQILVGAKQNRVLQSDLLLPPHSGRVSVEAFCVEHGRWRDESGGGARSGTFARTDNVSNPEVRAAARATKSQTSVWGAVSESQEKVKAPNSTSDLNKIYHEPKVAQDAKVYVDAFSTLPERVPDMRGAVVFVNGRLMAVDYFGDGRVFRNLWQPLLASYVLEAVGDGGAQKANLTMAREFLQRAGRADVTRQATPGAGTLVELNGVGLSGSSLLASDDLLHLELFARTRADDQPRTPNEPPIQRQYSR
ncbi:MAG: hypothetical protein FJX76_28100 [Armatimonadetes bacterium]|nr:hypothetical protein [Armatimonadota bacterium]